MLSRSNKFVKVTASLFIASLTLQFVRPRLTNPPVTAELQAPPEVLQVFKTSCYNCHSNETHLSWFDEPVPAYWLAAMDVMQARKHLNFSEIGKLPPAQQRATLFAALSQINLGAMPLPSYRRLHPESNVTPENLAILKKYLTPRSPNEAATPAQGSAADVEYVHWIQSHNSSSGSPALVAAPAPNGIAFLPDYKNWKTISSTERFDNQNLRVILGNDIAIKAIAENHINPWPDGTAFAKVAWFQQPDGTGQIRTGAFFQVEFMIRDSKKYGSTLGWGWARWRGTDLRPYGKDAAFTSECVGCHRPLANTDFVFTEPVRGLHE
jgi:mono/diheme cytochrome c family protein